MVNSLIGGLLLLGGNESAYAALTETVYATKIGISESNVDNFYPAPDFNGDFLTHSYNPMGTGENIFESCRVKVGNGGVRVENLLIDGIPHWADLILNVNHPSLPFELKNITAGASPAYHPEWNTAIPGVDFSLTTADVFGPPLQITLFDVGVAGKAYDVDFVLDNVTGLFPLKAMRGSGYLHYLSLDAEHWLGAVTQYPESPVLKGVGGISMSNVDFGDRIGFNRNGSDGNDYQAIEYGDVTIIQPVQYIFDVAIANYLNPSSLPAPIDKAISARSSWPFLTSKLPPSEAIDQCIENQTLINVGLKADNKLQDALYDLTFAIFDKLKIYDGNDEEAFVAVKSFISDSKDSIAEMIADGKLDPKFNTLEILIGTSIVKNATPEQHQKIIKAVWGEDEKNIPAHIQTLAELSGNVSETEKHYKQALLAFTKGVVSTAFPVLSATAKTIIQAQKWAIDVMSDRELQEAYKTFKGIGGGDSKFFDVINKTINPNTRIKIKSILRSQGKVESEANINNYLSNTFSEWYRQETQEAPKVKAALQSLKGEYLKDYDAFNSAMKKMLGDNASECEKFAKFNALIGKISMDLKSSLGKCKGLTPTANDIRQQAMIMLKYYPSQSMLESKANYQKTKLAFLKGRDCLNYEKKTYTATPVSEKAWVLVDIKDFNEKPDGNYTLGYSRGSISWGWSLNEDAFNFTATWSEPPRIIRASDEVTMDIGITVTKNTGDQYSANGSFSIWFDKPWIEPGFVESPIGFSNAAGEGGGFEVHKKTDKAGTSISRRVSVKASKLPSGADGAKTALLVHAFIGRGAGTRYTYEWKTVN